ncbi:MAG: hypothetical protein IPL78_25430 [Chloroflexi bacterium]|nr:hypothetical protein [Chloroflexota bacterium]
MTTLLSRGRNLTEADRSVTTFMLPEEYERNSPRKTASSLYNHFYSFQEKDNTSNDYLNRYLFSR